MPSLRVVVAPSGFKESLSAEAVAAAIPVGICIVCPTAEIVELPLVDGGEGFTMTLVHATDGELHQIRITGPVGDSVASCFGILGGDGPRVGVVEMAAAGLRLVPRDRRDPLATTTYGVGELITAALDRGGERLLIGCGDSGTNDGGAGMAEALGVRLLTADGTPIGRGGGALADLDRIDLDGRDPRLAAIPIDVACNVHNLLCGPQGVAHVFGPQQGASSEVVDRLARGLDRYADVIERDLGLDVRETPGGGPPADSAPGCSPCSGPRSTRATTW